MVEMWPGSAFPLGATPSPGGTGFAVASEVADAVILCLFDSHGRETQLPLPEYDAGVWHGFVPEVGPGQRYGYRVHGPYDPSRGLRCNPAKLLLDPYAKAIVGGVAWDDSFAGDNQQDSAPFAPRSIVVDPAFDWGDDRPPGTRLADSVIYETHVKGITAAHPEVPPELRGTYAGLGHPAVLEHLVGLGVTAVELLPVQRSQTNGTLAARGLTNYWGYDPIGFFAPHEAYSAAVRAGRPGGQVAEFQAMVRALHAAGLEVLLDVVYNHTAEGNEHGPTLCHRGLDNPGYYRLVPGDPAHYFDTTGTGNSLDLSHPGCLRMVLDSLRYWATVMGVDGFRFDLAATLAREEEGRFDRLSSFFDVVTQDPVMSQVKLIAEPWDVGQPDSYDVGRFPPEWSEWNGKFRDTVRDFWRSQEGQLGQVATRVGGSPDLYGWSRRRPAASINFITATTASPCATWSPTTPSTTRPMARPTGTGPTTTAPGTAEWRAPATTRPSLPCGRGSPGCCWPPWRCPAACRCCVAVTSSAAPRAATTTPTARTTRSPGTTGRPSTTTCSPLPAGCSPCATPTRCCAAATSPPPEIWAGTPQPARP